MSTYTDDFITDSGAEHAKPMPCSTLRKGGYVIMQKIHPCKIVEISTSKPGKHGSAKAHIIGLDIFSGKRLEEIFTTHSRVSVPDVTRSEHEVSFINADNVIYIFNKDMTVRGDLFWTEHCATPLDEAKAMVATAEADSSGNAHVEAVVVCAMGRYMVKGLKLKE